MWSLVCAGGTLLPTKTPSEEGREAKHGSLVSPVLLDMESKLFGRLA